MTIFSTDLPISIIFSEHINMFKDAVEGGLSILSIIPWFHAYGLITTIGMSICGAKLVTFPRFNEKIFLKSIEVTHRPVHRSKMCVSKQKQFFLLILDVQSEYVDGCAAVDVTSS